MAGGIAEVARGTQAVSSVTTQTIPEFNRQAFQSNVAVEQFKSRVTGGGFYALGAMALTCAFRGNLLPTVVPAVISIACAYFWSNRPYELAKLAYEAMERGDEKQAIAYIQQGANVNEDLSVSPTVLPFYSLGNSKKSFSRPSNLVEQAVEHECREVIKCLAQSGCNFNSSAGLLGHANSLEMVKLLVQVGANVNLFNGLQYSPLCIQIKTLLTKREDFSLERCVKGCDMIEYLLEQGAKLQVDSPANTKRFHEKYRATTAIKSILELIKEDSSRVTQLKNRFEAIAAKLSLNLTQWDINSWRNT